MTEQTSAVQPVADLQQLARVGLAGKTIAKAVLDATDGARDELLQVMATTGAEKVRVSGEDAANLGTVSLCPGKRVAEVVDRAAFTAYVQRTYALSCSPRSCRQGCRWMCGPARRSPACASARVIRTW